MALWVDEWHYNLNAIKSLSPQFCKECIKSLQSASDDIMLDARLRTLIRALEYRDIAARHQYTGTFKECLREIQKRAQG